MGFLKKSNAPSELPDLAMDETEADNTKIETIPSKQPSNVQPLPVSQPVLPQPEVASDKIVKKVSLENSYKETSNKPIVEKKKELIDENLIKENNVSKASFFDDILNDINGELPDAEKLEDWYEKKFVREDIVSNMKGYWEGNKADIIIQSFGAEYKRDINDKVRALRELEEDWREIYFKLIKKEEEMKKEERELKETVSEFVNLCKRRNDDGKERKEDENKK